MSKRHAISRREFIKGTAAAIGAFSLAVKGAGGEEKEEKPVVSYGLIGTGIQGQNLLSQLVRMKDIKLVALCDIYPTHLKKAVEIAGQGVKTYEDYRRMLDENKEMQAVIIATPPALHAEMSITAMRAGKDVFCETPLALSIEECKEIVKVAQQTERIFQVGNQYRYSPLYRHVLKFIKTGAIGMVMQVKSQWHRKYSWRRAVADPQYEKLLNWRLYKASSLGLLSEYGSLQLDVVNWFLNDLPISVSGLGGIDHWKDGREVYDNLQVLLEYPEGVKVTYTATLTNSYGGYYDLFLGTDGAILLTKGTKGLMFRETDAPALGWELYAKKEKLGEEVGIFLDADATKLAGQQEGGTPLPGAPGAEKGKNDFYLELEEFFDCIRNRKKPACGPLEGLKAAVTVIKAHEALEKDTKIQFDPSLFSL